MSQLNLDITPPPTPLPLIWEGVISDPPINFQARLNVSIPGMNPDLNFEQIRWQARDSFSLPESGDECLVIFDNNREPWVPVWWPADKRPTIIAKRFADGAPPNPVENDIWIAEDPTSSSKWLMYIYNSGAWEEISLVPLPVVNGKWIKGVGGAAVWTDILAGDVKSATEGQWIKGVGGVGQWNPITTPDLPPQWRAQARDISSGGNWNTITETGFYMGAGVSNAPDGNWYIGYVQIHIANLWVVQRLWEFAAVNPAQPYQRQCFNGAWQPWTKLGDWQAYQPWFNGSPYGPYGISGRFSAIGKTVHWFTELDVVNGTNTGPGDQAYLVGIPTGGVQLPGSYGIIGQGYMYNTNGGYYSDVLCQVSPGANYFQMIVRNVGGWGVAAVTPVGPPAAFAPGSQFICSGTYESTTYAY
jgi:hypothetical protein